MATTSYDRVMKMTRQLELSEQLRLLEALVELVRRQVESSKSRSIMELEGLGADVWKGTDANENVNRERGSWDY